LQFFKTAWIKNEVRKNVAISLLKDATYEINSGTVDQVYREIMKNQVLVFCNSDQDDNNNSFFS